MSGNEARTQAQRNRNSLFIEEAEILAKQEFAGEQFILRLRARKCAAAARAGSFVHVSCDEALPMRRPLSIMRRGDDWIDVLFKNFGSGMRALSRKATGDHVSLLGPIGKGFNADPDKPHCLLIGGGVGIPPMVFLADELRQDQRYQPFAILGSELPFPFELQASQLAVPGIAESTNSSMPLLESWGIPSRLTSLAGFAGCHNGYVTDLADIWLGQLPAAELDRVKIYTCGPTPMLRAVAALAERYGVACEVSLEEFMACAVGGCAGCVVKIVRDGVESMQRVCVDGPVFDAQAVAW